MKQKMGKRLLLKGTAGVATMLFLIHPAISMEGHAWCQIEEHQHGSECYTVLAADENRSDDLDNDTLKLTCVLPEHTHNHSCYSNPDADTETKEEWESTLPVRLPQESGERIALLALSQNQYRESRENYVQDSTGKDHGWNRYGAKYGSSYVPWSSCFVDFILEYAGMSPIDLPWQQEDLLAWMQKNQVLENYKKQNRTLKTGDLVFYRETVLDYALIRYGFMVDENHILVPDCDGQVKQLTRPFESTDILGLVRFDGTETELQAVDYEPHELAGIVSCREVMTGLHSESPENHLSAEAVLQNDTERTQDEQDLDRNEGINDSQTVFQLNSKEETGETYSVIENESIGSEAVLKDDTDETGDKQYIDTLTDGNVSEPIYEPEKDDLTVTAKAEAATVHSEMPLPMTEADPENTTFYFLYRKTLSGGWQGLQVQEQNDESLLKTCQLMETLKGTVQEAVYCPEPGEEGYLWEIVEHPGLEERQTIRSVPGGYYLNFTENLIGVSGTVYEYAVELTADPQASHIPYLTKSKDGINWELTTDAYTNGEEAMPSRYLHINSTGDPSAKTEVVQKTKTGDPLRIVAEKNVLFSESDIQADGTLSWHMYDPQKVNSSKRAYLEYSLENSQKSHSMGILRRTEIVVYAKAGETICLGSDVTESRLNLQHQYVAPDEENPGYAGWDIVVEPVYVDESGHQTRGKAEGFNVVKDGAGYIGRWDQEMIGPAYTGSGKFLGYVPIEYEVKVDGFYIIHFHSFNGGLTALEDGCTLNDDLSDTLPHLAKAAVNEDPVLSDLKSDKWLNCRSTVGAFDATVIGKDHEVQKGRAFCRYVALNVKTQEIQNPDPKKEQGSFAGNFYVATQDGYIYKTTFDIAPGGFLFFSNNRGIVDLDTNLSAYFSLKGSSQNSVTAYINLEKLEDRYTWQNPSDPDTWIDNVNTVFFEEPSEDLYGLLIEPALAPQNIDHLSFKGARGGNVTYVGCGGYFEFESEKNMLVTITLPFSQLSDRYEDRILQVYALGRKKNRVYWDGLDGAGTALPAGDYSSDQILARIQVRAGEIHFPFLDVEESNGISVERVNEIWQKQVDEEGNVTNQNVTGQYESSRFDLYYNNQIVTIDDKLTNNLFSGKIADGRAFLPANTSMDPAMKFYNKDGDLTILDLWNYTVSDAENEVEADFKIVELPNYYDLNFEGFVFFDANRDGLFRASDQDYPLSEEVSVFLNYMYCETRWDVQTDPNTGATILSAPSQDGAAVHPYRAVLLDDGSADLYQNENRSWVSLKQAVSVQKTETDTGSVYHIWIPVSMQTETDASGRYAFSGILMNQNEEMPANALFTVSVRNPREDYQLTTEFVSANSSFDLYGADEAKNGQILSLAELKNRVEKDRATNPDQIHFSYRAADVGFGEAVYVLPQTGGSGTQAFCYGWWLMLAASIGWLKKFFSIYKRN